MADRRARHIAFYPPPLWVAVTHERHGAELCPDIECRKMLVKLYFTNYAEESFFRDRHSFARKVTKNILYMRYIPIKK